MTRIIIDIVAVFLLSGIAYGVGYKAGKRFAVLMVRRQLGAREEARDGHGNAGVKARVIGAIVGRPAERIQWHLDHPGQRPHRQDMGPG